MWLLRLRWSLRDARARWIQIIGIAFTIAIGIGTYAGLSSVTEWRLAAIDESLELTNMYDLRATVSGGSDVPAGTLAQLASGIDGIDEYSERLVIDTQLETEVDGDELLVHGRVVGVEMTANGPSEWGPHVNGVEVIEGDGLPQPEASTPQVLLERSFAAFRNLPTSGHVTVGGDVGVDYVGHAVSPEYFLVIEGNGSLGKSNLAVMFAPLSVAQDIVARPGAVNDLVLTLKQDADIDAVSQQLTDAAASLDGTLLEVITRDETPSYIGLTNTPETDRSIFNLIALLLFVGAAFAALNFSARMVEAQRREIGASMALGETPRSIAIRPLLIGLQIGILGVVVGIGVGFLVGFQTVDAFQQIVRLPIFETPFQGAIYTRAAVIGFLVPVLAVFWPVVRAVRVRPVEAIRSGHLASRGGGLSPIISRLPLPGRSLGRMPFRNLMRAPRRTFLTLLTFTMSLAILFSLLGLSSTFSVTFERGDQELLGGEPERFIVRFDSFYPSDSPQVQGVLTDPTVQLGEAALLLGASVTSEPSAGNDSAGDEGVDEFTQLDLVVRFVDFGSDVWTPTASQGELSRGQPGIVLADKAARDFGVGIDDHVVVAHPEFTDGAFTYSTHSLPVTAIHPHPLRINAYMDLSVASDWGFDGLANVVTGVPADGSNLIDVKRALFGTGVALVQGLGESFKSVQDTLDQSTGVFILTRIFVIFLVLLIAFNTANINVDERARDHATMFAYGVPVRRVVANLSAEGLLLGVAAVVLGGLFGYALLLWMALFLMPTAIPEVGMVVSVRWVEMVVYFVLALVAIAVAPVFPGRKLKKMFIPGKLRVME
ncbi:FtsX-like permease family protein [Candidatus Poriferisodalis sp.]|uniref:ABC transporter permease n=1 Tax=Candidatus Poriferisodalis sp. TaxID=3101277 RepID=UPI003AF4AA36